jgi:hypothetical protein
MGEPRWGGWGRIGHAFALGDNVVCIIEIDIPMAGAEVNGL